MAIGEDGDIVIENGDFKIVKGEDCAKQIIMLTLSTNVGDLWYAPTFGSFFSDYYWKFKDRPEILIRLFKLEITRLLSIPNQAAKDKFGRPALDFANDGDHPPLDFINRVTSVELINPMMKDDKITINLRLEWGDGKHWEDQIPIFINPKVVS